MVISDFQISSVIKNYTKNMKIRAKAEEKEPANNSGTRQDSVTISDEGIKKMLFDRIGEKMTERLKRYE